MHSQTTGSVIILMYMFVYVYIIYVYIEFNIQSKYTTISTFRISNVKSQP